MPDLSLSKAWNEVHSSKPRIVAFYCLVAIGVVQALEFLDITPRDEAISDSYAQIMEYVYLSGGTTAQIAARKEQYIGKSVAWQGVVVDVKKEGWRGYTVSVGDTSAAFTDVYLTGTSESEAINLAPRDSIRFSGTIERFRDGAVTGYVYLSDPTLK